jgi:hypothetical protein
MRSIITSGASALQTSVLCGVRNRVEQPKTCTGASLRAAGRSYPPAVKWLRAGWRDCAGGCFGSAQAINVDPWKAAPLVMAVPFHLFLVAVHSIKRITGFSATEACLFYRSMRSSKPARVARQSQSRPWGNFVGAKIPYVCVIQKAEGNSRREAPTFAWRWIPAKSPSKVLSAGPAEKQIRSHGASRASGRCSLTFSAPCRRCRGRCCLR